MTTENNGPIANEGQNVEPVQNTGEVTETQVTQNEVTSNFSSMSHSQLQDKYADLREKFSREGAASLTSEDEAFFDFYTQQNFETEEDAVNGENPTEGETEENKDENLEEVFEIPAGFEDAFEKLGVNNLEEFNQKVERFIGMEQKARNLLVEADQKIEYAESALQNLHQLVFAGINGDESAIDEIHRIMGESGMQKPLKKEDYLTEEAYNEAVRLRELEQNSRKEKEKLEAQNRQSQTRAKIANEVIDLVATFPGLGISVSDARSAIAESFSNGNMHPSLAPVWDLMKMAEQKQKSGLSLSDCYKLSQYEKIPTMIKEEVKKALAPRRTAKPTSSLSHVQNQGSAPIKIAGKYSRGELINMAETGNYPPEWIHPGTNYLNFEAMPKDVKEIISQHFSKG